MKQVIQSSSGPCTIRPAEGADLPNLEALARRSLKYWKISDDAYRNLCRDLSISEADLRRGAVFVAEFQAVLLGYYSLVPDGPEESWMLNHIYIEKPAIGRGFGRILWDHACRMAAMVGQEHFHIAPEGGVAKVFKHMGCFRIGEVDSVAFPGKKKPLMIYRMMF